MLTKSLCSFDKLFSLSSYRVQNMPDYVVRRIPYHILLDGRVGKMAYQ